MKSSLNRELTSFLEDLRSEDLDFGKVSKAAFCKSRKNLNPNAFKELGAIVHEHLYSGEYIKWKTHRVLACDGSTCELPNSTKMLDHFGEFKQRADGKKVCLGRLFQMYDVLNNQTLDCDIDRFDVSEIEMLYKSLSNFTFQENDLFLFDRYFASFLLFFYLKSKKVNFCFKMKKDWWKIVESFTNSNESSRIVDIELPKKYLEQACEFGIDISKMSVRLVRVKLKSGAEEILLTSLTDEQTYSIEDIKELYDSRWGVETQYLKLKHKTELEHFSGKSPISIKQDLFAKVYILNLASALIQPIDKLLAENPKKKHKHKINFSDALAALKKKVISFFLVKKDMSKKVEETWSAFLGATEPVRPDRSFKRYMLPKNKKHMCYKPLS